MGHHFGVYRPMGMQRTDTQPGLPQPYALNWHWTQVEFVAGRRGRPFVRHHFNEAVRRYWELEVPSVVVLKYGDLETLQARQVAVVGNKRC